MAHARDDSSFTIELDDGQTLNVKFGDERSSNPARLTYGEEIAPRFWDRCPICGDPATDDEHVPPEALGGGVMTRTCAPCNNRLGSRIEADLTDWHLDALTVPRFRSESVRGPRRSSRIRYAQTDDGQWVLVLDEDHDPAVREMLESGQIDLDGLLPDRNRVYLALLKQAFLAACLHFGPLEGALPDMVRNDLLAARDAKSRKLVPFSELACGLAVFRSPVKPSNPVPLIHAFAENDDEQWEGVLLAEAVFVSWSSALPRDPRPSERRVEVSLDVGQRIDGVIAPE